MSGYIEGTDRGQTTLFFERLEDWIGEDNPVRVIDLFVDEVDLAEIGFGRAAPASTGRRGYRPSHQPQRDNNAHGRYPRRHPKRPRRQDRPEDRPRLRHTACRH